MNRYEILAADVRITQLMNVWYIRTSDSAWAVFARGFVFKTSQRTESKGCFPQHTFANLYPTVGTVVIMNRSSLSRAPTQHQHLHKLVATDTMPPIVTFFEANVWT